MNVSIPAGTTLSELTALNTGYEVTEGTCGGGAPGSRSSCWRQAPK